MDYITYDITKTFGEEQLRPSQVLDFWSPYERDDPRHLESKADEATMSMEDWKAKWAPNLKFIPLQQQGGSVARQHDKFRSSLEKIADEAIALFELDKIPAERLQDGSAKKQLKVKTGGNKLTGEASVDEYISLRLKKPYLNIWINIYKEPHVLNVHYRVGTKTDARGEWEGTKFTKLEDAKKHFFTLLQEAKERSLF